MKSTITKYRISNRVIKNKPIKFHAEKASWIKIDELENYMISSISKKILSRFL